MTDPTTPPDAGIVRLVPREPTAAMMEAALRELSDVTIECPKAAAWDVCRAWRAMYDAASPAPANPEGEGL